MCHSAQMYTDFSFLPPQIDQSQRNSFFLSNMTIDKNCPLSGLLLIVTYVLVEVVDLTIVIWTKLFFWVKAVSSSMGVIQNKIIQSFFSMGETCDKLVRLSQAFFIYTELKLLYRI